MWDNLKRALKDTTAAFLPPGYLESLDMINDVSVDGLSRGVERFGDVSSQFHIDIEDHYDRHKQQHIGSHMQMDVGPAGGGKNPWSERLGMRNWDVVGDVALALELLRRVLQHAPTAQHRFSQV